MRGIPSLITEIRKKVFTEVARMAYSGDYTDMEDIPFKIVPGQSPLHRESVFLERAIAGERVRLAMGLSLQPVQTRTLLTEGMDQAAIAEQYYEPPLVNIIPYACHACPTRQYRVNELCQGCLASSCQRVCPKGAIKFVNGKSRIDQKLCIKCGKCARSCPYNAITYLERPCQAACGMDAIGVDEYGKACIDYDRCVSCGQCLVSCPFGAIVDKSQIYQVIRSMLEGNEVVAIVAPSFVGQFGKDVTVPKFLTAMKQLGFADVVEVAVGADICTIEEARDFMEKVPEEFVCVVLLWWWVTSMRLETMVASTVRRGELLFLCQRPMPRTAVTMNMMKMPTNMTVKITGKTEFIKSKPNIAGPLFLFVSTISDAGAARKFPAEKEKNLWKIPFAIFPGVW